MHHELSAPVKRWKRKPTEKHWVNFERSGQIFNPLRFVRAILYHEFPESNVNAGDQGRV